MTNPKLQGLLLDVDYETSESSGSTIKLYIKTEKGIEIFSDPGFKPYFYVIAENPEMLKKDLEGEFEIEGKKIRLLNVEIVQKNNVKNVLKLAFKNTNHLTAMREKVKELQGVIERREYDIPFAKRYLIDKQLSPMGIVEFEAEGNEIKEIKHLDKPMPSLEKLKIGCFDLETLSPGRFSDPKFDPIIMISYSNGKESVIWTWKNCNIPYVRVVKDEKEMIESLINKIREEKLDAVATYNGDRFDMPYILERAKKFGIRFGISADCSEPQIKERGQESSAKLKGLQHVDVYQMMKFLGRIAAVDLIKYDLESVYESVFGTHKYKVKPEEINTIWETGENFEYLARYNKEDAEATMKLGEEYLQLFIELSKLVRQTLFEINRTSTGQLVEYLLINKSFELNNLIPNRPSDYEVKQRMMQSFKGGHVIEPKSGLHENIAVLDFRSLHPTIMISHNISPETIDCSCCKDGKHKCPTGNWFCEKKKGFFSGILENILEKRIELKNAEKKLQKDSVDYKSVHSKQHGLKILLNSFYGSLGYARFRWYNRDCARAVTAWSRHYIMEVSGKAGKEGFETLYGDSITKERFVTLLNPEGQIEIVNIEEFFNGNLERLRYRDGKEVVLPRDYMALSVNPETLKAEWMPIKEIIRHKTKKKVYKINQKFGEVCVSEDHSLMRIEDGKLAEIKPAELAKQNLEMHKVLEIPAVENEITKIDLYEYLKNYNYDTMYKGRVKISQVHKDENFVWFGWTERKEHIKIKRSIAVESEEFRALCRLLGAYIAEGSSSTPETTETKMGASIASSNVAWLEALKEDYGTLFANAKSSVIRSAQGLRTITYSTQTATNTVQYEDMTHKLQMMNETAAVFFKVLAGQKSYGKHLPSFIFNVPDEFKKMMLEKIVEGDGSRIFDERYTAEYKRNNFRLDTKSLMLASGLSLLLTQLGQKHSIRFRKEKSVYRIDTVSDFNARLETKIEEIAYDDYLYDLSVAGNNNFVDACGQILLHNTDSVFLQVGTGKTEQDILKFVDKINSELPGVMELEFQGMYKRGIFVTKKEGGAAKKRYALIDFKGNLKIVGFEYVRRDWAVIAKKTQKDVIEAVLKEGRPERAIEIVKKKIAELKSGEVKKADLIIMTQIKKSLKDYAAIGPHIAAAKKAIARGKQLDVGSVLSFIITRNGKSISDRAELEEYVKEGNYDADYYLEHQLLPAVIKIMQELGYGKEDLLHGGKQSSLSSFG